MDPTQLLSGLDQQLSSLMGAASSTNEADFQEKLREFNLNYANSVAQLYGYNNGPGQPAAPGMPTLSAQQDIGAVGMVPGLTGFNADQSLAAQNQYANIAAQQAGMTGVLAAPEQSQYAPGSFVQLSTDPSQTPADVIQQNGPMLAYVQPNGQLQPLDAQQAQAMGYKGGAVSVPYQTFMALTQAPPQQTPQQTLQGLQAYQQLNSNALQQALSTAGATGMFQAPQPILAPGVANDGSTFFSQPQSTQQAYMNVNHTPEAAMQAWVKDQNAAINNSRASQGLGPMTAYGANGAPAAQETLGAQNQYFNQAQALAQMFGTGYTPGTPGSPNATSNGQETLAAQNQYANQANQLATLYGQYYAPLQPGQQAQAGVNAPQLGQSTEAARQFNINTQSDLAKLASSLSGPADYFKYLTALNGGRNILSNLSTGQAQPAGGAPVGSTQPQSLDNILANLGLGGGSQAAGMAGAGPTSTGGYTTAGAQSATGGSPLSSSGSTTGNGGVTLPYNMGTLPQMNQIQPTAYNSMSPSAQQFVQGAYAAAGYNPQDLQYNLQSETPATGSAPRPSNMTTSFGASAGSSAFG